MGGAWAWKAPKYLLWLLPAVTLLGWLVLAAIAGASDPRPGWKLVVTCGASIALAAAVLAVAVQSFVGNDRGLPAGQLASLAKLAGTTASDRGTDAVKTIYGWREDQWRQLAKGVAGVVVALLVAIVPLLLKAPTSERVYSTQTDFSQSSVVGPEGLPLVQVTVSGAQGGFPPALWVAMADLLLLAVLAAMFARGAHRSYVRDIADLADRGP